MTKEEQIKEIIENLLKEIETEGVVSVLSEDEIYKVQIDSENAATLIGFHGENLRALQTISSFLVHQRLQEWVRLQINIGDYLQKREDQLKRLALNLAVKAKFSKETQMIPNLTPNERRFIHMVLTDNPDVFTESEGEGKLRCLMIKPKV